MIPTPIFGYAMQVFRLLLSAMGAIGLASALQLPTGPIVPVGTVESFQHSFADDLSSAETIRKEVDEVRLVFSVRNTKGKFVTDLREEQVRLLDDDRPPEKVQMFEAESALPLRIAVLIDSSDSVADRFEFEKKVAVDFLRRTLRQTADKAFLAGFNERIHVVQDWTTDSQKLEGAITTLRNGGETALYDAVGYASRKLVVAEHRNQRRAVILITDGMDNRSRIALNEAINEALRAEAAIYVLSTNAAGVNMRGEKVLDTLANTTGGRVLRAARHKDIARAFDSIQQELRSQYVLGYKPANFQADGRFRTVELKVHKCCGLHVCVRHGYYSHSP